MLQTLKRATYHVENTNLAKEWYQTLLNQEPIFDSPFVVMFQVGDSSLTFLKGAGGVAKEALAPQIYWEVDSMDEALHTLIELGATEHTPVKRVMNIDSSVVEDPFGNLLGLTSTVKSPNEMSVEKQASSTALAVTLTRALATFDTREELKGADTLAFHFLDEQYKMALATPESRHWSKEKVGAFYGTVISRTTYGDSLFCQALLGKRAQIVILGAGYDTRAYRFAELNSSTTIFEVDAPQTQKRKRAILEEKGIETPHQLTFVGHNFKDGGLMEELGVAGYSRELPTLFVWEGVSCYLPKEAVRSLLIAVGTKSAPGSLLFFDYLTEEQQSFYENEPFKFWISQDELTTLIETYGLSAVDHVTPEKMEQHFLALEDGTVVEKAVPFFSFLLARVE